MKVKVSLPKLTETLDILIRNLILTYFGFLHLSSSVASSKDQNTAKKNQMQ